MKQASKSKKDFLRIKKKIEREINFNRRLKYNMEQILESKTKILRNTNQERKERQVWNKRSNISEIPEKEQKGRNCQRVYRKIFPRTEDHKSPNKKGTLSAKHNV